MDRGGVHDVLVAWAGWCNSGGAPILRIRGSMEAGTLTCDPVDHTISVFVEDCVRRLHRYHERKALALRCYYVYGICPEDGAEQVGGSVPTYYGLIEAAQAFVAAKVEDHEHGRAYPYEKGNRGRK